MLISLYQMATEVAGISGKNCRVFYGDCYGIRQVGNELEMIVPQGVSFINPSVRSSIIHEAMHGRYTNFYDEDQQKEIFRSVGVKKPDEQRIMFEFMNVFEDIRIELKGAKEYPGCHWLFQDGFDYELAEIMENWDKAFNEKNISAEQKQLLNARLWLTLNIFYLTGYYMYPDKRFPGLGEHDAKIENYTYSLFGNWWQGHRTDNLSLHDMIHAKTGAQPPKEQVQRTLEDIGHQLRDTKDSAECFVKAAELFLPYFLTLLPPDLGKALGPQGKGGKSLAQAALEAIAEAIADGSLKPTPGGGNGHGTGGKLNGSTAISRAKEGHKDGDEKYTPQDNIGGRNWTKEFKEREADEKGKMPVVLEKAAEIKRRLAPVIQEIKEYQETGGEATVLKRGKLDLNRVYRIGIGEDHVFKKDINPEFNDDIAFSILVDCSGSMFDGDGTGYKTGRTRDGKEYKSVERAVAAASVCYGINQSLEQIDRYTSIVAFSNSHKVICENGQRMNSEKVHELLRFGHGGTDIGSGANAAIELLKDAEQKSKILMLITDGYVDESDLGRIDKECHDAKITPYFIFVGIEQQDQIVAMLDRQMRHRYHKGFFPDGQEEALVEEIGRFAQELLTKKIA